MIAFTRLVPAAPAASPAGSNGLIAVGAPAPALEGVALDGSTVSLAALRGRPVIINFWASWCGPCRAEFPMFRAALTAHANDGLAIIGVVFKDDAGPARAFASEAQASWPSLPDATGVAARAYRVVAPPQTFFVDRSGIVRRIQVGQVADSAELNRFIAEITG